MNMNIPYFLLPTGNQALKRLKKTAFLDLWHRGHFHPSSHPSLEDREAYAHAP
jgi:hypothetical protein